MKKYLAVALAAMLLLSVPASAHPPIQVYVDGQEIAFDQPPVIIDDRTLVPMRAIFSALGCEVSWSEPTQTVTSTLGKDSVLLRIGDTALYKNGELVYTMPVPARIQNERTLVPVRAIAEAFDATVSWDEANYIVTILSSSQNGAQPANDMGYSQTVKAADGTTVLSCRIDVPRSSSPAAEQIASALHAEATLQGESFVKAYRETALAEYEAAQTAGTTFAPYYHIGNYDMTRDDSQYVSFFGTATQYTGGQQDLRSGQSHTYSAQTGAKLALSDLIEDSPEEIAAFLSTSFLALMHAGPTGFYADGESRLQQHLDHVEFYLTKDGIGFFLQPGTIAPVETGIISFSVKYTLK